MNPKISLGTWAFAFGPFAGQPWPLPKILQYAKETGYDGVELNGFRPHPHQEDYNTREKCRSLVEQAESYGLGFSGYAPDFQAVPPAIVEKDAYLSVFKKCLQFCVNCRIHTLRVDTVSPPEPLTSSEYETRFARLANTWHAAANMANNAGVRVVWEFEPGFWLNKPSEVKRIAEAVDHPNFQILFDTSHAYMSGVVGARQTGEKEVLSGGVVEYAQLLLMHIGHFHLIDSDATLHDEETSTHAPFGKGLVTFKEVLQVLRPVISKMPWWCVDFCFNADVEQYAKDAVPYLRALVGEVG